MENIETTYKCPNCGWETLGVMRVGCPTTCICAHCQQAGNVIYMQEQKKESLLNRGDGFFIKPKNT